MDSVSSVKMPVYCHENNDDVCPICLDDVDHGVVKTQCGHRYHLKCADSMLRKKLPEERECAICRQKPLPLVRESGALLYEKSPLCESLAIHVCRAGDISQLEKLIAKNPATAKKTFRSESSRYTLLYQVSLHGHIDCLNTLIKAGACVDSVDTDDKVFPLHGAASSGHLDCLTALINAGANLELATASRHSTALCVACEMGNADCVEALVAFRANIEATERDGSRPLHLAARKGHLACLQTLIKAGADVNAKANTGETPLSEAFREDHIDCAQALIKSGADIIADLYLTPPLIIAAGSGSLPCVRELDRPRCQP